MNTEMNKLAIEELIRLKREEMIEIATQYGYTNERTLQSSQELDSLLNQYHRFFYKPTIREIPFLDPKLMIVHETLSFYA